MDRPNTAKWLTGTLITLQYNLNADTELDFMGQTIHG